LLLCFFLSGLSGLVYQTAWTRQFTFVFGTSELAIASVLAAYMGGLAVGAAAVARLAPRVRRPILVYGILELAIGLSALAVPWAVGGATKLYVSLFGSQGTPADEGGLWSALFYLASSFVILLVPTGLMGATLPLLARHAVRREEELGRRVAHLYATNTAGAVVGTLLTGFVLLPRFGLATTVWIAVATNLAVFAVAAALARAVPILGPPPDSTPKPRGPDRNHWVLGLMALSGAVSFTYEVLWTRLLGHVLGGSVHAFATMLATFLLGIALGSWLTSGRLVSNPRVAAPTFAWAQVGIGLLSLLAYLGIEFTPGWVEQIAATGDARLLLDAAIAALILLPGTLCIGATFPLAVRILARSPDEASSASARTYAWNTLGAITGAIGAGFFLIPAVGFAWTLGLAVASNAAIAFAAALRAEPRPRLAMLASGLLLAGLLFAQPTPPWQVLRMGAIASQIKHTDIVYYGVGRSATVLLQDSTEGWQISSNGLAEAQISRPGVRPGRYVVVRWMSNLPAWGRPDAKSMLVVGFGGGLIVEAVPPNFEKIDVVELESEMIAASRRIADSRRADPLSDPRIDIIVNDARGALLLTEERYDAILSQPSHPWTAGSSHLYTREFFQLVRDHLTEDGVFVQWMGLGFIDEALFKTLLATLQDVFPHVRVYRPSRGGLLFTASPMPFEPERLASSSLEIAPRGASEIGVRSGADIVAHMLLDDEASRSLAHGAAVNTDDRNLLQMNSPAIVRARSRFDPAGVVGPLDPLAVPELEWDREYLVRRLIAGGLRERAARLVEATTDRAEREVGLGFLARAKGQPRRSLRHFQTALEIDPSNREARLATLEAMRRAGAAEADLAALPLLTPLERRIITGWEYENDQAWGALRQLEDEFERVPPWHPAFAAASRLRVAWRMADGSKQRAEEALLILDALLPLAGTLDDLLARAEAAGRAGYEAGLRSAILELTRKLRRNEAHARVARNAIVLLNTLPESQLSRENREQLQRQLRRKLK